MILKPKTCQSCRSSYIPRNSLQKACSPACAITLTRKKRDSAHQRHLKSVEKSKKAHLRARKAALKTKSQHIKELQAIFNKWVRLRDRDQPCISCGSMYPGEYLRGGSWDAGHFLSRGSHPELRFEPDNCHKQCKRCNSYRSGAVGDFRVGLIKRIGKDRVEALENREYEPLKLTIEEICSEKSRYSRLIKDLKKTIDINQ